MEIIFGFIKEHYGYIYCFLGGVWIGIIVVGVIFSNFTMDMVDKIDSFIERKIKERKERKSKKIFEKQVEEYVEVQRRFKL